MMVGHHGQMQHIRIGKNNIGRIFANPFAVPGACVAIVNRSGRTDIDGCGRHLDKVL